MMHLILTSTRISLQKIKEKEKNSLAEQRGVAFGTLRASLGQFVCVPENNALFHPIHFHRLHRRRLTHQIAPSSILVFPISPAPPHHARHNICAGSELALTRPPDAFAVPGCKEPHATRDAARKPSIVDRRCRYPSRLADVADRYVGRSAAHRLDRSSESGRMHRSVRAFRRRQSA